MKLALTAAAMLVASIAIADDEPSGAKITVGSSHDPRTILVTAFADQRAAVDRAAEQVRAKVEAAVATRAERARAAYKLLRADTAGEDQQRALAIARRRAAVRWLLARDRAELGLLVDESTRLRTARERIEHDAGLAATIALPAGLIWPARGTIARKFGPYVHDKSGATLTRRGLDLEVADAEVDAVAPAAGTVRYAGPIRGLDAGVIVDHGDYLTVIAKLATPAVHAGDTVEQGTRLGHPARHRLYVEVRVEVGPGGTPIDPESVLPAR